MLYNLKVLCEIKDLTLQLFLLMVWDILHLRQGKNPVGPPTKETLGGDSITLGAMRSLRVWVLQNKIWGQSGKIGPKTLSFFKILQCF